MIRFITLILFTVFITGCHTAAGVVQGAGKDLTAVGRWIEPKDEVRR